MLVRLEGGSTANNEWCLLEFQGEIIGDLAGNELGRIEIKEVKWCEYLLNNLNLLA